MEKRLRLRRYDNNDDSDYDRSRKYHKTEEDVVKDSIELLDLPDELVLQILRLLHFHHILHSVSRIRNHRLRRICDDDLLWADVVLDDKELTLDHAPFLESFSRPKAFIEYCRRPNFDIVGDNERWRKAVDSAARNVILKSGGRMRSLRLRWWWSVEEAPGDLVAFAVARCPNLARLKMDNCAPVTKDLLAVIGQSTVLLELTLVDTRLRESILLASSSSCLSRLTLFHPNLPGGQMDACLRAIADHCRSLEDFCLQGGGGKTRLFDGALGHFLRVTGGAALRSLTLQLLGIQGLTGVSLVDLGHCRRLRTLRVYDAGELLMAGGLTAIAGLAELTELSVKHVSLGENNGVGVVGAFEGMRLAKLTCLRFDCEPSLDDEALVAVAGCCPYLVRLELNSCSDVTLDGIREAVTACPRLRHLEIPWFMMRDKDEVARPMLNVCSRRRGWQAV